MHKDCPRKGIASLTFIQPRLYFNEEYTCDVMYKMGDAANLLI